MWLILEIQGLCLVALIMLLVYPTTINLICLNKKTESKKQADMLRMGESTVL